MARRNANGEGSVSKRKDGRWEGAKHLTTVSGRSKRIRVYGKTKVEAQEKLTLAVAQALQGTPLPDKAWTVGDYIDYWLENATDLRPTTARRYRGPIRLYLKPALGKHRLAQLTVPAVQSFLNQHISDGHSVRSAQVVQTILSAALTNAQREELISRNVARLVRLPAYERADVIPWTVDEVRSYIDAIKSERLSVAFLLLVYYGLRRGEVLGLRWQDVNVDRRVLRVRQQIVRYAGALHAAPLKTKASKRDLPLSAIPALALDRQRSQQTKKGLGTAQGDLVFTTDSGNPIDPDNFGRAFRRLCAAHGLRPIKLHHVRHTTATLLKDFGVPARDTQLILGHSNLSTTQEIYQHDSLESRAAALSNIEKVMNSGRAYLRTLPSALPSNREFVMALRSIISGSTDRVRTCDLRLMRPFSHDGWDRVTSINHIVRVHGRTWKLGCVAVNFAVKDSSLELAT